MSKNEINEREQERYLERKKNADTMSKMWRPIGDSYFFSFRIFVYVFFLLSSGEWTICNINISLWLGRHLFLYIFYSVSGLLRIWSSWYYKFIVVFGKENKTDFWVRSRWWRNRQCETFSCHNICYITMTNWKQMKKKEQQLEVNAIQSVCNSNKIRGLLNFDTNLSVWIFPVCVK